MQFRALLQVFGALDGYGQRAFAAWLTKSHPEFWELQHDTSHAGMDGCMAKVVGRSKTTSPFDGGSSGDEECSGGSTDGGGDVVAVRKPQREVVPQMTATTALKPPSWTAPRQQTGVAGAAGAASAAGAAGGKGAPKTTPQARVFAAHLSAILAFLVGTTIVDAVPLVRVMDVAQVSRSFHTGVERFLTELVSVHVRRLLSVLPCVVPVVLVVRWSCVVRVVLVVRVALRSCC